MSDFVSARPGYRSVYWCRVVSILRTILKFSLQHDRSTRSKSRKSLRRAYVAGDDYSIADIDHFGWLWQRAFAGVDFEESPNVARWYESIALRPAVLRAIAKVEALAA